MRPHHRTLVLENRQISIRMEQMTDQMVGRTGLSAAQAHLLLYILCHADEGISLTDIHREFGYSMGALSNILKRLRGGGDVRAEVSQRDYPRKRLYGTEKALAARSELEQALRESCEAVYRGFSEEELCQLEALQKRMLENLVAPAGAPETIRREWRK